MRLYEVMAELMGFGVTYLFVTPWTIVLGILQAIILEWIAVSFSRRTSQPRDQTQVSELQADSFYHLNHQGSPVLQYKIKV